MQIQFLSSTGGDTTVSPTNPLPVTDANTAAAGTGIGAVADAAVSNPASSGSVIALNKGQMTLMGALTEAAPASDTASSGLNGRLQRIAQRLTSLLIQGLGLAATALRTVPADDSGPTTTARLLSAAASTNGTNVKGSAGVLYAIRGYNTNAAARYVKIYNKATTPTVGTDTPVITLAVEPLKPFVHDWPAGRYFATGIGYGMTTAGADADTSALTAGDIVAFNVDYR